MSKNPERQQCMLCKKPLGPLEGRLLCHMDHKGVLQLAGELCEPCARLHLGRDEEEEDAR